LVIAVLDGSQVDGGTTRGTRILRLNPPRENDDSVLTPKPNELEIAAVIFDSLAHWRLYSDYIPDLLYSG